MITTKDIESIQAVLKEFQEFYSIQYTKNLSSLTSKRNEYRSFHNNLSYKGNDDTVLGKEINILIAKVNAFNSLRNNRFKHFQPEEFASRKFIDSLKNFINLLENIDKDLNNTDSEHGSCIKSFFKNLLPQNIKDELDSSHAEEKNKAIQEEAVTTSPQLRASAIG